MLLVHGHAVRHDWRCAHLDVLHSTWGLLGHLLDLHLLHLWRHLLRHDVLNGLLLLVLRRLLLRRLRLLLRLLMLLLMLLRRLLLLMLLLLLLLMLLLLLRLLLLLLLLRRRGSRRNGRIDIQVSISGTCRADRGTRRWDSSRRDVRLG
jgi:hypothetical protein